MDDDRYRRQCQQITTNTVQSRLNRVEELKNTFDSKRNEFVRDDSTVKYQCPMTTAVTEQRRKLFEEKQCTRRPVRLKANFLLKLFDNISIFTRTHIYIYIYIYMYVCIYINIYLYM